jgi:hypothetical protein
MEGAIDESIALSQVDMVPNHQRFYENFQNLFENPFMHISVQKDHDLFNNNGGRGGVITLEV